MADYPLAFYSLRESEILRVLANPDSDPELPVVSDCNGMLHSCEIGPSLVVGVVPTESHSFGTVKSLYSNP